jgi:DNA-binding Xre family transcriptional regulator
LRQRELAKVAELEAAGYKASFTTNTIKLDELDVICAVLGCGVEELLLPEPDTVPEPKPATDDQSAAVGEPRAVTPRPRTGRSLPPR